MSVAGEPATQDHEFGLVTCDADIYPENRNRIEAAGRRATARLAESKHSTKPSLTSEEIFAELRQVKERRQDQG